MEKKILDVANSLLKRAKNQLPILYILSSKVFLNLQIYHILLFLCSS